MGAGCMAIGERIHFFRLLRGMTQKYLGMALGFPEKSADDSALVISLCNTALLPLA